MGSSTEMQDLVMGEGSKMLIDAASEVSFNQSEASITLRQPIIGCNFEYLSQPIIAVYFR